VIVVDDVGYNLERAERLLNLPGKLTLGLLPFAPHSPAIAKRAKLEGKEIILHQPMESIAARQVHAEPGTLTMKMSAAHFNQRFSEALAAVPFAVGVNNHSGSLLTQHRLPMDRLMQTIAARGMFFLDSRTTPNTVALATAHAWQVSAIKRDVFLDHVQTSDAMQYEFQRALTIARRKGHAVLIAHPHRKSLEFLEQKIPALPPDIVLTSLSELLVSRFNPADQSPDPSVGQSLDQTTLGQHENPVFPHRSLGQ